MKTKTEYKITDHGNGYVVLEIMEMTKDSATQWNGHTTWSMDYGSMASALDVARNIAFGNYKAYYLDKK